MTHGTETWLPVVGWEDLYEVSNLGRLRSLDRERHIGRWRGQLITPTKLPNGYLQVCLYREGRPSREAIHVLVLEAFAGLRPPGMVACHGVRGKSDNSALNLEWGTQSQNTGGDRLRDGTDVRGERHGQAKLTWEKAAAIRSLHPDVSVSQLAHRFDVGHSTVYTVIRGESWMLPGLVKPEL